MTNLVLYRKYRPQTFDEVIGQKHVTKTLQNAIASGDVSHAYLFVGPRGTGKTTVARLFAKAVKCDPADLFEIDAASNRSINDIRNLRDGIRVMPTISPHKVFIIDEVHMLTPEAFNALLKTLEEPPAHALFVLATTEIHKVPQTITSRCQRFDFHFVKREDLKNRIATILKKEKRKVSNEIIDLVITGGGGSVRDAESLLGNVLVLGDDPDIAEVRKLLGLPDMQKVGELVGFFLQGQKNEAMAHLSALYEEGIDVEQFIKGIIRYMRGLMVTKVSPDLRENVVPDITEAQLVQFQSHIDALEEEKLYGIIRKLIDAENEMKYSSYPHVPLELAVLEICQS